MNMLMKRFSKTIQLLLMLVLPFLCHSQNEKRDYQKVKLGLTVSPSVNWVRTVGADMKNNKLRFGFNYGFVFDYHFSENYALGTGINMNHQSFGLRFFPDSTAPLQHAFNIQSIQIPLTLKLKTKEIGYMTYYGQLGVLASARVSGKAKLQNDFDGTEKLNITAVPRTQLFNFSLNAGGGIEFSVAEKTSILAGLEYHNGFVNQFRIPQGATQGVAFTNNKATLNEFVLRLGVLF